MLTKSANGIADYCGYYPMLATIVTSKSKGHENAMAVAWHAIVSTNPPSYGVSISPRRFTHGLISESNVFAVNFLPGKEAELIAAVGGCSGRDVDKFKEFGIERTKSLLLDVPIVKTAYFALECKVVSRLTCGDHDWFVGRIVATHWSDRAFDEECLLSFERATPTVYLGSNRYFVIRRGAKLYLNRKECIVRRRTKVAKELH